MKKAIDSSGLTMGLYTSNPRSVLTCREAKHFYRRLQEVRHLNSQRASEELDAIQSLADGEASDHGETGTPSATNTR